jgi:hypothetical protein
LQTSSDDVSSCSAAAALFDRLLAAGASSQQLEALEELLASVWVDGVALPDGVVAGGNGSDGGGGDATAADGLTAGGDGGMSLQGLPAGAGATGLGAAAAAQEGKPAEGGASAAAAGGEGPPGGVLARAPLSPLHGCWHALFTRRLQSGEAAAVLAHLDQLHAPPRPQQQPHEPQPPQLLPLTPDECQLLLEVAMECASPAAAATLALLAPCGEELRAPALQRLQAPGGGEGMDGDPFALHLLAVLLVQGEFGRLAATADAAPASAAAALGRLLYATAPHPAVWCAAAPEALLGAGDGDQAATRQLQLAGAILSQPASLLLPHALAQLVQAGRAAAAASLAATRLRLHPALSSLNGQLLVLERVLGAAARAAAAGAGLSAGGSGGVGSGLALPASTGQLVAQLPGACKAAHALLVAGL